MRATLQSPLALIAQSLATFLEKQFTDHSASDWWQQHVLDELTYGQQGQVKSRGINTIEQLDLAALLRVFERNWYVLQEWAGLPGEVRTLAREVTDLRHAVAHSPAAGDSRSSRDTYRELDTLERFATALGADNEVVTQIRTMRLEALTALTLESFPESASAVEAISPAPTPAPVPDTPVAERPDPTQSEAASAEESDLTEQESPKKPDARAIGKFRLFGPENSVETEIAAFDGRPVAATEIPWRVTGPAGIEFKIHVLLIDDPEEGQEIGQIFCESRLESPQRWDEVVRRLRVGIRLTPDGNMYMDLRVAIAKPDGRSSRRVIALENLREVVGLEVSEELVRLGALRVGTRSDLLGEENPRTANWPCVTYAPDDLLTPVAAWVATTLIPLV